MWPGRGTWPPPGRRRRARLAGKRCRRRADRCTRFPWRGGLDGGDDERLVLVAEQPCSPACGFSPQTAMRGGANPSSRMALSPSSMVCTMRWVFRSQAWRSGTCVLTCTVASRSLASNMRDSAAPHNSAMYSVCPVNGRPESVTASLFSGAVTMASASRITHIRWRFGRIPRRHPAARIQAAEGEILDIAQSEGIAQRRRCECEAGGASRHLENPRIADYDPVGQRRHFRVGQRFEHNLRADPGGVSHGERDGGQAIYGVGM